VGLAADTIIPEPGNPQALNRYSYVLNNPLKYTDPTGHCEFDAEGNITRFDCSVEEFENLSAAQRIKWMDAFQAMFGYGGWFNNIVDIITFFSESPTLHYMQSDSWASWADAGVLEAIQNGHVLFEGGSPVTTSGGAADLWKAFFYQVRRKGINDLHFLKPFWAKAEQAGVDWGTQVADQTVGRPTGLEGALLKNFISAGNLYRGIASVPYGGEAVGGGIGWAAGCFVSFPLGCVVGAATGSQAGDWFTTPSSSLPSGKGPTWYSAKIVEELTITLSW